MNRRFLMAGLALAGLTLGGATSLQAVNRVNTVNEIKATPMTEVSRRTIGINAYGGLDFPLNAGHFGLTPKEYGMIFGNGKSRKHHTNKLRCKHNAKLKRR